MKGPLVSIVIPVYNVEQYLDDCVNSVVMQSYTNLEIILVDDKSPDKSPRLCDEWRIKDNRIIVIHKETNEGLGEARNSGLDVVHGKYTLFLDSDDYIHQDAIRILVDTAEKESADIVGSGEYGVKVDGRIVINSQPIKYHVYRGEDIQNILLPNIIAPDPVTKERVNFSLCLSGPLFSTRVLKMNDWRCASERNIISEDTYSFIDLCSNINCVVELPVMTVYYRENPNSLSHVFRSDRKEKNIDFYNMCVRLVRKKGFGIKVEERLSYPFLSFVLADIIGICKSGKKHIFRTLYNYLSDDRVRDVIVKGDFRGDSFARRLFVLLIKNHCYCIAILLTMLKNR